MSYLRFAYPVSVTAGSASGSSTVACRDVPELHFVTDEDLVRALDEAEAALNRIFVLFLAEGATFPLPSLRETGEYLVAPSPHMIVAAQRRLDEQGAAGAPGG